MSQFRIQLRSFDAGSLHSLTCYVTLLGFLELSETSNHKVQKLEYFQQSQPDNVWTFETEIFTSLSVCC